MQSCRAARSPRRSLVEVSASTFGRDTCESAQRGRRKCQTTKEPELVKRLLVCADPSGPFLTDLNAVGPPLYVWIIRPFRWYWLLPIA